jgi:hypothetical protein
LEQGEWECKVLAWRKNRLESKRREERKQKVEGERAGDFVVTIERWYHMK